MTDPDPERITLANRSVRFFTDSKYNLPSEGRFLEVPVTPEEVEILWEKECQIVGQNRDKLRVRIPADMKFVAPTSPVTLVIRLRSWKVKSYSGNAAYLEEMRAPENE